jgi:glycosyltransferase involved in cell wall biosynthesis
MKIGFIIYGDINTVSGGYLYDRKLISFLEQQGDTVKIISLPQRSYGEFVLKNISPNLMLNEDFDILIEDELVHPSIFRTNKKLKNKYNFPIISLVHLFSSYAPKPFYNKLLNRYIERKYLQSIDGLILNSQNTLDQAQILLNGELPPHIVAVPAGNNFKKEKNPIKERLRESGQLNILYVGTIIKQKGLDVIVRALANLNTQDFKLTITGRTDMEPKFVNYIYKLINKLELSNQIVFTGPLQNKKLVDTYRSNDVLVLPSINEAYGIVYIEALSFGLPVIGTTTGGAKEIISHGENGYLIEPNDSIRLAEYLSSLQRDRNLLNTLSKNTLHTYQHHPTWNDTCQEIRIFLQSFLQQPKSAL